MGCALAAIAPACDHDAVAPAAGPRIAVVSGNYQETREGSRLSDPLSVRVTGVGGAAQSGVEVVWQVIEGSGELRTFPDNQPMASQVSLTDADGVARIYFFPTVLGQSVVTASAGTVTSAPAKFFANQRPRFEIAFGPVFDCTPFSDPSMFSLNRSPDMASDVNASVSVSYSPGLSGSCTARVKVTFVADGHEVFDSGILHPGEAFVFTPRAIGTWQLTDVVNGGSGLLIVR